MSSPPTTKDLGQTSVSPQAATLQLAILIMEYKKKIANVILSSFLSEGVFRGKEILFFPEMESYPAAV